MQMNKYVKYLRVVCNCACVFFTSFLHFVRTSGDTASKRSKLVLPAPQISDSEIDEVVKLGVTTSSVGGVMTPLIGGDTSFRGGITPRQTPFRTPDQTPSRTPVRDQLSINMDNDSFEDIRAVKQQQQEIHALLKVGLGTLPEPKNDFELVLPDNEVMSDVADSNEVEHVVEDATDVEVRGALQKSASGECIAASCLGFTCSFCIVEALEWQRQSQSVQRSLPRPTDVNTSILRGAPHKDQKFRELYKVQCIVVI